MALPLSDTCCHRLDMSLSERLMWLKKRARTGGQQQENSRKASNRKAASKQQESNRTGALTPPWGR
eukprot:2700607-Lingulodinium_polyedra.AAC.1